MCLDECRRRLKLRRGTMESILLYRNGALEHAKGALPQEFPLNLTVNGREIATLVASPHDLRFLVAGFLRLQGFVDGLSDFLVLSVCQDSGIASVQVRKELPERLKPVLTSGCGTGITFTVPRAPGTKGNDLPGAAAVVTPAAIFAVMDEMAGRARSYKLHGGIHSAALAATDGTLLLYAEDIGRHNTIDRLWGKALKLNLPTKGLILLATGRISSEMLAKAAKMEVPIVASRTSATSLSITLARAWNITIIGYVRRNSLRVYTAAQRVCGRLG